MENIPESLKINDENFLICLNNIKAHVAQIWDPPLLQHYTKHGIDHSQRIIDVLGSLLEEHDELLSEQERFILLAAIYLHDIGMQSPIDAGLPEKEEYTLEDSEIVRKKHNETSANIIRKGKLTLGLNLCKEYSKFIATLSEYHRKLDINDLTTQSIIGKDIRLKLLAALLRLGDELDLDFRRVNVTTLKMRQIPVESKFHWFSHYYIQSVQIKKGKIKLWYRFPEKYREQEQLTNIFCKKTYESVKKQFLEVYDILDEYGLRLYKDIQVEKKNFSFEGELELIPDDLNDYINKNVLKTLEISEKLNKQTNVSWNIDGVLYSDDFEISRYLTDIFKLLTEYKYNEAIKLIKRCNILTMAPKERIDFSIIAGNCYSLSGNLDYAKVHYRTVLEFSNSTKIQEIYGDSLCSAKSAALGGLGVLYCDQGDFQFSILYLGKALEISRNIKNKRSEAIHLSNLGDLFRIMGKLNVGIDYLAQSIEIMKQENYKAGLANNFNNMGLIYIDYGNLDTALDYFKDAMDIYNQINDLTGKATVLINISKICHYKGDFVNSLRYLNKSLAINKNSGYRLGMGTNLSSIGILYVDYGDYDNGLKYLKEAIDVYRKIGYKIGEASVLNHIAIICLHNNNIKESIKYLEQALKINKEINYNKGISNDYNGLGMVYGTKQDYKRAIEYLEMSLNINKQFGYELDEAQVLVNMGIIYGQKRDLERSLDLLNSSLIINRRLGNKLVEAINLEYIGVTYTHKGELENALRFLNEALDINRRIKRKKGEASVLANMGLVYIISKDHDEAINCYEAALNIFQHGNNLSFKVVGRSTVASLYFEKEDYESAFKNLAIALSILPEPHVISLALLNQILTKLFEEYDWNTLKNIEIMYNSGIIENEMMINFLSAIHEYSLIQVGEINSMANYNKLCNKLDSQYKIILNTLLEV